MGNHPSVNLMVCSSKQAAFSRDVKGLYKKNSWAVATREIKENLFTFLHSFPTKSETDIFVLTQAQVNEETEADLAKAHASAARKGRSVGRIGVSRGSVGSVPRDLKMHGMFCQNTYNR